MLWFVKKIKLCCTSFERSVSKNDVMENKSTTHQFFWLIPTSQIKPGNSAIIGDNFAAFYTIHYTAIGVICLSVVSCFLVIVHITWIFFRSRRQISSKKDFPLRFPLYLAIADLLWGVSHLTDHVFLVVQQKFSEDRNVVIFSLSLWFCFGYQQIMHASLAAYMYLKVVRHTVLNLGRFEWKFQFIAIGFMGFTTWVCYYLHPYGCAGYWYGTGHHMTGSIMNFVVAIMGTGNAIITTFGYHSIKQRILKQRAMWKTASQNKCKGRNHHYSIASDCLSTFVKVAACIYCPFAITYWVYTVQSLMGFVEPITAFVLAITANSSGWANSLGYVYNQRLKCENQKSFLAHITAVGINTTIIGASEPSSGSSRNF